MKGKDHGIGTRQKAREISQRKLVRRMIYRVKTHLRGIYEKTFKIVPHNHICVCELLRYGCKFWLLRLLKRRSGTFDDEARVSMGGPWELKFLFHSSLMQEERMFVTKKINYNNSPDSTLPKNSTKPNGMG